MATDTNDIFDVWGEFYFRLFWSQDLSEGDQGHFLDPIERRLTPGESRLCEGDLTIEECSKALSNMPSAKSLGVDSLPGEFFSAVLENVGPRFSRSLQLQLSPRSTLQIAKEWGPSPFHKKRGIALIRQIGGQSLFSVWTTKSPLRP